MDWVESESVGLSCPGFADEFAGGKAFRGLQPTSGPCLSRFRERVAPISSAVEITDTQARPSRNSPETTIGDYRRHDAGGGWGRVALSPAFFAESSFESEAMSQA